MSKISILQLPKDKRFLKCFTVPKDHKLLYTDINSLEPHVLAHFSQDPGLMSLYGPGAAEAGFTVEFLIEKLNQAGIKYQIEGDELVVDYE